MSLVKKAASGLFWTFSQQFVTMFTNFLVSVILARLMSPSQFGLIGMVAVFMALGEVLMNGGLANSLIRTENPDQVDYSTVFFFNLGLSVVIYWVIFLAAPLIGAFFHQRILVPIVRVYMLNLIFYAFSAVPGVKLTKELKFKKLMIYQLPSVVISGLLGITLAFKGCGVWSLVFMALAQAVIYSVQLWFGSRWLPSPVIDLKRLKQHFGFGSRLVLSAILDRLYANLYNLVIGRFYSPAQLGYYSRSNSIVQIPAVNLYDALNKVSFPVLSSIKQDTERLALAYKKLMQQVLFIIIPVLAMMMLTAEPLFRLLLTEKWLPAVPYFRLLCAAGILSTANGYNLTILLVKGRSDLYLRLNIIEKIFITAGILASVPFGIYGLLYFQVISSVVIYVINGHACGKLIDYPVIRQLRDIAHIFLIAVTAGLATGWMDRWMNSGGIYGASDLVRIISSCVLFMALYVGISMAFNVREIRDFYELFLKNLGNKYLLKSV